MTWLMQMIASRVLVSAVLGSVPVAVLVGGMQYADGWGRMCASGCVQMVQATAIGLVLLSVYEHARHVLRSNVVAMLGLSPVVGSCTYLSQAATGTADPMHEALVSGGAAMCAMMFHAYRDRLMPYMRLWFSQT